MSREAAACASMLATETQMDYLHSLCAQLQVSLGDLACWSLVSMQLGKLMEMPFTSSSSGQYWPLLMDLVKVDQLKVDSDQGPPCRAAVMHTCIAVLHSS